MVRLFRLICLSPPHNFGWCHWWRLWLTIQRPLENSWNSCLGHRLRIICRMNWLMNRKGRGCSLQDWERLKAKGGKEQIVITETLYEINKATHKKIDDVCANKVAGIVEVRDESDSICPQCHCFKKKITQSLIIFQHTDLQITITLIWWRLTIHSVRLIVPNLV